MALLKIFWYSLFLLALSISSANAEIKVGKDYLVINSPQPTQSGKKIEVIEFFYYGCPHCYDLQPALKGWLKKLPKDVEFRSIPAIFRDSWVPLARTFYTLEALGLLQKLHDPVYDAIHVENIGLSDQTGMLDWVAKQGVDRQKFADAYGSFSMQSKVAASKRLTREYQITGTPSLVVEGKYLISGGNPEAMVQTLDELVKKTRKERAKKG